MNTDEAKTLIDRLFAYYPNAPTVGRRRREVVEVWSPRLRGVEFIDGIAAVAWLVEAKPFLPALSELLEACRMAHRDRTTTVGRPPDLLLDEPEPPGGYMTFAEWKAGGGYAAFAEWKAKRGTSRGR